MLQKLGSTNTSLLNYRVPWIFIGSKSLELGQAIDMRGRDRYDLLRCNVPLTSSGQLNVAAATETASTFRIREFDVLHNGAGGCERKDPHPDATATGEFSLVIPSYQREAMLVAKSLPFLHRHGIRPEEMYIFLADDEERERYMALLNEHHWRVEYVDKFAPLAERSAGKLQVVVGRKGIRKTRNLITQFFPEGHHVVSMDDDVTDVRVLTSSSLQLSSLPAGRFRDMVVDAELHMRKSGAHLWGLNASPDPRCMTHGFITMSLGEVGGNLHGILNRKLRPLKSVVSQVVEDVERSLRFFAHDKIVLRYRGCCVETKYGGAGGIQATYTKQQRDAKEQKAIKQLADMFPSLIKYEEKEHRGARVLPLSFATILPGAPRPTALVVDKPK